METMMDYKIHETRVPREKGGDTLVFEVSLEDRLVATFERNYPSTCYKLIEQDGKHWILCSENYHGGMTAINLTDNVRFRFDPVKGTPYDQFWCLGEFGEYNPDAKTVKVHGCYWACPWQITTYDVSDPSKLPWPVLSVEDET